jgi:hypothetical protein
LITLLINISPEEWSKSAWGEEPPVKIEATIINPKSIYYTKEPIWLQYRFYNISNEDVKIWFPTLGLSWSSSILRLEVVDEKGERIVTRFCVMSDLAVRSWEKEGGGLLIPGDTLEGTFDIGWWFFSDLSNKGKVYIKNLVYTNMIGVIHSEPRPLYKPFWWGTVKTPLNVEVNIISPIGEEKEVESLLFPITGKEILDDYMEIVYKYPTSVYIPVIFRRIKLLVNKSLKKGTYMEYPGLLKAVEWYIENFKTPEHEFPEGYWNEWIEKSETIKKEIKENKERYEK